MRASGDALLVENGPIKEYLHLDDENLTIQRFEDVEPILKNCKASASNAGGKNKEGDWYHAGRFPFVIVQAWLTQRGLTMKDFKDDILKDFVNDQSHSAFRIWPGRV